MNQPRKKEMNYKISSTDKQIDQALRNVYEKYGPDLNAFFKELQVRQQKPDEREARVEGRKTKFSRKHR
jgi:hypothetical protein